MSSFVKTLDDVAQHLELPALDLYRLSKSVEKNYRTFRLPKKSGGFRLISAPSKELKTVQKWIAEKLLAPHLVHQCATGYRKGFSIVDNASVHAGKDWVYNIDIEQFFPSIKASRVEDFWKDLGFSRRLSRELTRLTTLSDELPQGAPSSPALANLICRRLDERLFTLANSRGWAYTRYCDDITFSGTGRVAPRDQQLIQKILEQEGFSVNQGKVRINRRNTRQTVTGLVVNSFPNVQRKTRRRVRAMLHQAAQKQENAEISQALVEPAVSLTRLHGYVAFLNMVRKQAMAMLEMSTPWVKE